MKIKSLKIQYFRHIKNQEIEFGEVFTVITGQNSTGKSSLLGWIAQACDFKGKIRTLNGKSFKSKYSEIFRFCPDNDYSKKYSVSLVYDEDNTGEKEKSMTTRYLPKTKMGVERYRVDFDGRSSAIDFPVIYLGLKRLIPLASEKKISLKSMTLTKKEKNRFSSLAKEILILLDKNILSERIQSTNKDMLAMKTDKYAHLGNSAGQDNIGQVISAMISFERLKDEQGDDYCGGLLLIDEIDTTLYAGSQIKLIERLFKFAKRNNIQVIFTTHSLEILENLSEKTGEDTKINFLELRNNLIKNTSKPNINFLRNKIKSQTGQDKKIEKVEIVCEDDVTETWCKNLLNGTNIKKYVHVAQGPFGDGDLVNMAESKHSIFKNIFFILDGDCRKKYKNTNGPQRTVFLPEIRPPEVVLYDFIFNLNDDDPFWIENDDVNYSRQTCFQDYPNNNGTNPKRWFKDKKFEKLFGRGHSRLFNRWKNDNKKGVLQFQNDLSKVLKIDI